MDPSLHNLRRDALKDPDHQSAQDRVIRSLIRAGHIYDARKQLRTRFALRDITFDDLNLFVELGRQTGFVSDLAVQSSSLLHLSTLFHARRSGLAEIELEIGFAGVHGAGALVSVVALADFFGAELTGVIGSGLHSESTTPVLNIPKVKPSETCYEFRLELRRPIRISTWIQIRTIRVSTIPIGARNVTLRRRVLRTVNALAFVIDSRSTGEGESNEHVFARVNRDFEDVWGSSLRDFRLAVQYTEPARAELHRALLVALGLGNVPRIFSNIETTAAFSKRPNPAFANFSMDADSVLAHEGVLDTFALLLSQTVLDLRGIAESFRV